MNELTVIIEKVNDVLVTTSNRVAKELEVEHKNLLRKIDEYIEKFGGSNFSHEFYIESTFENRGKTYRNYLITEKGVAQLIGGYSAAVPRAFELNIAYINKFEEMKRQIALNQFNIPKTYSEALRLAAEQADKIEELENINKHQTKEIIELKPKAEFTDMLIDKDFCITISALGRFLAQNGFKTGPRSFHGWLQKIGWIYKAGQGFTKGYFPKQRFIDYSNAKVKAENYGAGISAVPYFSVKGQMYIFNKLKSNPILRKDLEDYLYRKF